jgi:hypothetical protein
MAATPQFEIARNRAQSIASRSFFRNIEKIVEMGGMDRSEAIKARGSLARAMKKKPIREKTSRP